MLNSFGMQTMYIISLSAWFSGGGQKDVGASNETPKRSSAEKQVRFSVYNYTICYTGAPPIFRHRFQYGQNHEWVLENLAAIRLAYWASNRWHCVYRVINLFVYTTAAGGSLPVL